VARQGTGYARQRLGIADLCLIRHFKLAHYPRPAKLDAAADGPRLDWHLRRMFPSSPPNKAKPGSPRVPNLAPPSGSRSSDIWPSLASRRRIGRCRRRGDRRVATSVWHQSGRVMISPPLRVNSARNKSLSILIGGMLTCASHQRAVNTSVKWPPRPTFGYCGL
jgi:hypothetical protein